MLWILNKTVVIETGSTIIYIYIYLFILFSILFFKQVVAKVIVLQVVQVDIRDTKDILELDTLLLNATKWERS